MFKFFAWLVIRVKHCNFFFFPRGGRGGCAFPIGREVLTQCGTTTPLGLLTPYAIIEAWHCRERIPSQLATPKVPFWEFEHSELCDFSTDAGPHNT